MLRARFEDLVLAIRRAAGAFHAGEYDYHLALTRTGGYTIAYRGGTADESVLREAFEHDIHLPAIPEYHPQPNDVVLDVGAHIGTFSLLVASRVGTVHALEPSSETFNYLRVNLLQNGIENVVASPVALGAGNGTATLHHDAANWGHTLMIKPTRRGETVRVQTLDSYLAEHRIDRVGLLRMNAEGAEFPVLLDASDDALARVDTMLILCHEDRGAGHRISELESRLAAAGFSLEVRNRGRDRGWIAAWRDNRVEPALSQMRSA